MEKRLWSVYISAIGGTAWEKRPSNEFGNIGVCSCDSTAVRGSGGATFVTMMKPAQLWDRDDPPGFWCLDGA
jgi:hypothetical protein